MTSFVINARGQAEITKDPDAVLDYTFDWTDWLASASTPPDTIVSGQCAISGDSAASISSVSFDQQRVTAWVQGGTVGAKATLRCRITTAAGRIDDRSVFLKIKER